MELKLMPDLPGYAITRDGRIFSLPRVIMRKDGKPETIKGGERKQRLNKSIGYMQICFKDKGGKVLTHYVHRLVAKAFLAECHDKAEVNHIDGNKQNNNANNLEWVTRGENNAHKYRVLKQPHPMDGVRGIDCKYSQPIEGYDPNTGKVIVAFAAMKDAHRVGYKAPAISRCIKNPLKTHRGMRWRRQSISPTMPSSPV